MSSNDFFSKAVTTAPGKANSIIPNKQTGKLVQLKDGSVRKAESNVVKAQFRNLILVPPSSTVSSGLFSAGLIEFRLSKQTVVDNLTSVVIKITLSNATGAAVVLAPVYSWIDRWELYGASGNKLLSQTYGNTEMFHNLMFINRTEYECNAASLAMTTSYGTSGVSLANGATATYYVPLYNFFSATKLHLAAIPGDLVVRIRFNPTTLSLISGAAPTITDINLQLRGLMEPDAYRKERVADYTRYKHDLPFLSNQRQSQTLTLAPSTTYNIILSGFRGICSCMAFVVQASPITSANQYTYFQMQDFDLQDQSGISLRGSYRTTFADTQLDYARRYPNLFLNNINSHVINFSDNPVSDYHEGTNNGFIAFNSFEKLSITSGAA